MQYFLALILFASPTFAFAQETKADPPKVTPSFKTVAPPTVKAGEHILVDASSAKGDVFFFYDETAFPKARATQVGKLLILSTSTNGSYTINIASLEDKAKQKIVVSVTGGTDPLIPPIEPPTPNDPLEALKLEMRASFASLNARIVALEGAKPPPGPTALAKHLTFVAAELSQAALATNNDAGLRAWLKTCGVTVHVLTKESVAAQSAGFVAAVTKAGGPPCVVIQDAAGNVLTQGPITSVAQVQELASQFIRR